MATLLADTLTKQQLRIGASNKELEKADRI